MRAILPGEDGQLNLSDLPVPEPVRGEVRIRVQASGVNRADLLQAKGLYPAPKGASPVLGLEVAGEVDALGEGVTEFAVGDPVCALLAGGGYAAFSVVDAGSVLARPAGLSAVEAACLPEALFTVWANVFEQARLQPGERFLQHGGTSGIGVIAIQMARRFGAEVFATARTDEKCDAIRTLGATAINYTDEDFESVLKAAGGVDVILDIVGGAYVQKNINSLRERGRCVNIAFQKGSRVEVDLLRVMLKKLTLTGTTLRARSSAEKRTLRDALLAAFGDAISSGDIAPVLDRTYPLSEAAAAHARMASSDHIGKLVLTAAD